MIEGCMDNRHGNGRARENPSVREGERPSPRDGGFTGVHAPSLRETGLATKSHTRAAERYSDSMRRLWLGMIFMVLAPLPAFSCSDDEGGTGGGGGAAKPCERESECEDN